MKKLYIVSQLLFAAALLTVSCEESTVVAPELKTPVVNITTDNAQLFMNSKQTEGSFDYEIVNPRHEEDGGGAVAVEVIEGASHVLDFKIREFRTTGTVSFTLEENTSQQYDRNIIFLVKYTYGENEEVAQAAMTVVHKAEFAYRIELQKAVSVYYGEVNGSGLYNYEITLGSPTYYLGANVEAYTLDLYSNTATDDMLPPAGIYTLVDDLNEGVRDGSMSQSYTCYQRINAANTDYDGFASFAAGEVVVERDGDNFVIYGEFIDGGDITHYVNYEGVMDVRDGNKLSTYVKDTELDLTGLCGEQMCYTDPFGNGSNVWSLSLMTETLEAGSPMIGLQLVTSGEYTAETGLPTAVFNAGNTSEINTFTPGYVDEEEGSLLCCWFYTCGTDGTPRISDPVAPMTDGQIRIVNNGNGTLDIEFDVLDDAGHRLTGTAKGVPVTTL